MKKLSNTRLKRYEVLKSMNFLKVYEHTIQKFPEIFRNISGQKKVIESLFNKVAKLTSSTDIFLQIFSNFQIDGFAEKFHPKP